MTSLLFRKLIAHRIHERVRGGYRLSKLLARQMTSVPIVIRGYPALYVDLSNLDEHALSLFRSQLLERVPHEAGLTELFRRLVNPGDTVFDVGANLGLHTLTFSQLAKEVAPSSQILRFFPNLRRTLTAIPNAKLLEVCLGENDGSVEFHISNWDHMLGSISNWTGQPTKAVVIPARSIDSLIAKGDVSAPQVLKVDVEGAELLVFRGADKLFRSDNAPRVVIFEELNPASRKLRIADGAPAEYLRSKGYHLYLIEGETLTPLPDIRPHAANLVALRNSEA